MDKEASFATIIRGTEFWTGVGVNILLATRMIDLAVTLGVVMIVMHMLTSILLCICTRKSQKKQNRTSTKLKCKQKRSNRLR